MRFLRLFGIGGVAVLLSGCAPSNASTDIPAVQAQRTSQAVLDEELVKDFKENVDKYMKLHDKAQNRGDRQKQRDNIDENLVSSRALAMRIRSARPDARPGDLFTPPIAMAIRRALDPELRGDARLTAREAIRAEAPETFVLAVNADYPEGAARSTMPGRVLKILPQLPAGLEYRIVDTHLVLMDRDANIIVDYVLDVMCKTC